MATRSPNYPSLGLSKAIEAIKKLWATEKRSPFPPIKVVETGGYSTFSGSSRTFLSGVRQYGFLEESGNKDFLRLSPLAIQILAHPEGSSEYKAALKEAALTPRLFSELYETFREASDGSIKAFLITQKGFSDDTAKRAIKSFRDTIRLSGLDDPDLHPQDLDDSLGLESAYGGNPSEVRVSTSDTDANNGETKPPPKKGVLHSIHIEILENGEINVESDGGKLTSTTLKLITEVFELKEKYETKPPNEGFDFSGFNFSTARKQASE